MIALRPVVAYEPCKILWDDPPLAAKTNGGQLPRLDPAPHCLRAHDANVGHVFDGKQGFQRRQSTLSIVQSRVHFHRNRDFAQEQRIGRYAHVRLDGLTCGLLLRGYAWWRRR